MIIRVNYRNPNLPQGPVDGNPVTVPVNTTFRFHSVDGALQVQFQDGRSPLEPNRTDMLGADNDFTAVHPGRYVFKCFLDGVPLPIGGEMEVPPGA